MAFSLPLFTSVLKGMPFIQFIIKGIHDTLITFPNKNI